MGGGCPFGLLGVPPVEVLGNPLASCRSWCSGRRPRRHLRRRGTGQHTQGSEHGHCLRRRVSPGDVDQHTKESGERNLPLVIRHPGDDHLGSHCQPIGDAALDLQRAARLADITRKIGINRLDELNRIKIESRLDLHRRSRHRLEILTPPAGSRLPAVRHDTILLCPNPAERGQPGSTIRCHAGESHQLDQSKTPGQVRFDLVPRTGCCPKQAEVTHSQDCVKDLVNGMSVQVQAAPQGDTKEE